MKLDKSLLGFVMFVGIACGVFFLICLALACCGGIEKFSHIGGAFNILSALFAGLAFAAICSQLRMQQSQIDEEREARYRSELISALSTRIDVTFQKILIERGLLLKVAPGFKNVSFLHPGDGDKTADAIKVKSDLTQSLSEMIAEVEQRAVKLPWDGEDTVRWKKQLLANQAALPMMKQIHEWVIQLEAYENEMDGLLKARLEAGNDMG